MLLAVFCTSTIKFRYSLLLRIQPVMKILLNALSGLQTGLVLWKGPHVAQNTVNHLKVWMDTAIIFMFLCERNLVYISTTLKRLLQDGIMFLALYNLLGNIHVCSRIWNCVNHRRRLWLVMKASYDSVHNQIGIERGKRWTNKPLVKPRPIIDCNKGIGAIDYMD